MHEENKSQKCDWKTHNKLKDERERIFSVNDVMKCNDVGVLKTFQ